MLEALGGQADILVTAKGLASGFPRLPAATLGERLTVPVILVLGAIAAGLTEFRRLNARAVAEV